MRHETEGESGDGGMNAADRADVGAADKGILGCRADASVGTDARSHRGKYKNTGGRRI